MNKKAVLLADTRPALIGNMLLQLQATNPHLFDEAIIYYIENLKDDDKSIMQSIMPCRFIEFNPSLPDSLFKLPCFKRFSKLMFARYEMFNLINEYESIVWLDTDILIQGDISQLQTIPNKSGFAILSEDPKNKSAEKFDTMRTCFSEPIRGYNLNKYLYCTGTIVVTNALEKREELTKWCYDKTIEWRDYLLQPDQGVINALIQEFKIDAQPIGNGFARFPTYGSNLDTAAYIHTWGRAKLWNDYYLQQRFPKWQEYYEKWISTGGSPLANAAFTPDISVVIPVYKPNAGWLKECLNSVLRQIDTGWERYSNFEVLLITEPYNEDEIKAIVYSYNDPRIKLEINDERLGLSASLNKGMKLAQGRYIARIDADDIASEMRLYKQKEYLDKHSAIQMCVTDYSYFGDMNESRCVLGGEKSKAWSIFTCPFDHPTIMFRRNFFTENGLYYDETMSCAEDWALWIRAYDKGMVVGCIHEELTRHRWHSTNAGQTDKTVETMNRIAQANFAKLGVEIDDSFAYALRPWSGKLSDSGYDRLSDIFGKAIAANCELKLYDTQAMQYVFDLRLKEAKTGILPVVVTNAVRVPAGKKSLIKRIIRKLIMPFYRPIYYKIIEPLRRIENGITNLQGQFLQIENLINEVRELGELLTQIDKRLNKNEGNDE